MRDSEHERLSFELTLVMMKKLGCEMYLTAGVGLMVCLEHPDAPEHELQAEGICPFARHQVEALVRIHSDGRLPAYRDAVEECGVLLEKAPPPEEQPTG